MKQDETIVELRARTALAGNFAWLAVSGIASMCFREKGEATLNELWRRLMTAEQKDRFLAALDKLEIRDNPPAVTAALYHYHSNSIGGLDMQIVVESPRKAWIRYMPPWGSFPGMAALVVPPSVRRTILSTWHPRNGELLGCPRLGWVATKFVAEGHPYDEGYFYEYEHDLKPDERFRVEHVEKTPEFRPETAPRLDPETWPEARVLKGGYNYAVDYVRHTIETLVEVVGVHAAMDIVRQAMRLLAVQYASGLAAATDERDNGPEGTARFFGAIFASFRNEIAIEGDGGRAVLRIRGFMPFTDGRDEYLRQAVFEFFEVSTRLRNGHVSIARGFDEATSSEVWTLTDEGKWLW